jgi:hypothetical protein
MAAHQRSIALECELLGCLGNRVSQTGALVFCLRRSVSLSSCAPVDDGSVNHPRITHVNGLLSVSASRRLHRLLLDDVRVNKLTTIDIDDTYRVLSRCGGARRSQMLGLRWADISTPPTQRSASAAPTSTAPSGPVLRVTKTHRTYRVAFDDAGMQRLHDRSAFASRRIVSKRHRRRLAPVSVSRECAAPAHLGEGQGSGAAFER